MPVYRIPARQSRAEIYVTNSRFIATASPAFSVEEARAFIQSIHAEFRDASHNVPAFLVGWGASVTAHCSDDGEPSGTAGRPALAVLQGSGLGDIAVVITRYFGGTKLGTGGLVRAYTDAVKAVLAVLPLAQKVPTHTILLALPYPLYEQVRLLAGKYRAQFIAEDFGADVTLTLRFRQEDLEPFNQAVSELSRGQLQAVIMESDENSIYPL